MKIAGENRAVELKNAAAVGDKTSTRDCAEHFGYTYSHTRKPVVWPMDLDLEKACHPFPRYKRRIS
jgi:hypothetical protein